MIVNLKPLDSQGEKEKEKNLQTFESCILMYQLEGF